MDLLLKQERFMLVMRYVRLTDPAFKASQSRSYRERWYLHLSEFMLSMCCVMCGSSWV